MASPNDESAELLGQFAKTDTLLTEIVWKDGSKTLLPPPRTPLPEVRWHRIKTPKHSWRLRLRYWLVYRLHALADRLDR